MIEKLERLNFRRRLILEYVLASMKEEKKSGYILMKEIDELTKGRYKLSKSFLYPLIDELNEKGYIKIVGKAVRKKVCYILTEKGRELLDEIEGRRQELFKELRDLDDLVYEVVKKIKGKEYSDTLKEVSILRNNLVRMMETGNLESVRDVLKECNKKLRGLNEQRRA